MPNSCWGRYSRVAVVQVDPEILAREGLAAPRMISERARGVIKIIHVWERCHEGATERCAAGRARADAHAMIERLHAEDRIYATPIALDQAEAQ